MTNADFNWCNIVTIWFWCKHWRKMLIQTGALQSQPGANLNWCTVVTIWCKHCQLLHSVVLRQSSSHHPLPQLCCVNCVPLLCLCLSQVFVTPKPTQNSNKASEIYVCLYLSKVNQMKLFKMHNCSWSNHEHILYQIDAQYTTSLN